MSRASGGSWGLSVIATAWVLFAIGTAAGCKQSNKTKEKVASIEGIAAIPDDARVVIGFDVRSLAANPVVRDAVEGTVRRDPKLVAELAKLKEICNLELQDKTKSLLIGVFSGQQGRESVIVATGDFEEAALVACLSRLLDAPLESVASEGRVLYRATGLGIAEERSVWLAFGSEDTAIVSSNRALLERALAGRKGLADNPEMAGLIAQAGPSNAIWAAGLVPEDLGQGLAKATGTAVPPPRAMYARLDLRAGVSVVLGLVFSTEKDSILLISKAKPELQAAALIAQRKSLGPLVNAIVAESQGPDAVFSLTLDNAGLARITEAIDNSVANDQNPGPNKGP